MRSAMPGRVVPCYMQPMNAKIIGKGRLRTALLSAACCSWATVAIACQNSDAQASKDVPTVPSGAQVARADAQGSKSDTHDSAPQSAPQSSYKEAAFHLTLSPPQSVQVGKPAVFQVILEALGEYKVNDEYPIKFQFEAQEGTTPKKMTVSREDAKIEKNRAEMPLSVTIESAGKRKVSGRLSFSVCTEERCLIEKRELSVEVDAS